MGTPPGNWGYFPIGEELWNESSPKKLHVMLVESLKDEAATDQVVGEVMAHQAFYRCGPWEREPGDGY